MGSCYWIVGLVAAGIVKRRCPSADAGHLAAVACLWWLLPLFGLAVRLGLRPGRLSRTYADREREVRLKAMDGRPLDEIEAAVLRGA